MFAILTYMNTLNDMIDIAREAGRFMLGSREVDSTDKTNTKDFVTVLPSGVLRTILAVPFPVSGNNSAKRSRVFCASVPGILSELLGVSKNLAARRPRTRTTTSQPETTHHS